MKSGCVKYFVTCAPLAMLAEQVLFVAAPIRVSVCAKTEKLLIGN